MTAAELRTLAAAWAERFAAERERLGRLDAATGDGDHGAGMQRGFARARTAVDAVSGDDDVGAVLTAAGKGLMSGVGGASGALFATVLLEIGKAAAGADTLAVTHLATGTDAAVDRIGRLGRSAPGDKTMLDALAPAAESLAADIDDDVPGSLVAAADAAERGAEATRDLPARHGRARHVQGAGVGHVDPGAVSLALLLRVWAEVAAGGDA